MSTPVMRHCLYSLIKAIVFLIKLLVECKYICMILSVLMLRMRSGAVWVFKWERHDQLRRCSHVYAYVIRTRHPLPLSARGVHVCTRPSSVKYVEHRIAFCLFVVLCNCFYGKLLKCVKCGFYMCKSSLWLC